MEKTNELNKLLSYIHMGNTIYRIYYNHALEINDELLLKLIVSIQEIFKKHEEKITEIIKNENEEATKSITSAGLMGIYKEKLRNFENTYSICKAAIKSTNMGMISTLKFLKENENLSKNIKDFVKTMINDYLYIQNELTNFIINNCINN